MNGQQPANENLEKIRAWVLDNRNLVAGACVALFIVIGVILSFSPTSDATGSSDTSSSSSSSGSSSSGSSSSDSPYGDYIDPEEYVFEVSATQADMYDIQQHVLEVDAQYFSGHIDRTTAVNELEQTYEVIETHVTFFSTREPPDEFDRVNDNLAGILSDTAYEVSRYSISYQANDTSMMLDAHNNFHAIMREIESMDPTPVDSG